MTKEEPLLVINGNEIPSALALLEKAIDSAPEDIRDCLRDPEMHDTLRKAMTPALALALRMETRDKGGFDALMGIVCCLLGVIKRAVHMTHAEPVSKETH